MIVTTDPLLAAGGDAVARAPDGRVVFVEGAAPSEEVEVEVTKESPRFLRARAVRVVRPGPSRVEAPCPYFGRCGGCAIMHVAPEAQLESKVHALVEVVRRVGGVAPEAYTLDPPWSGAPYGYRTRARFATAADGRVGFRRRGSREVVDVERCLIAAPPVGEALVELRARAPRREGEVEVASDGKTALIGEGVLFSDDPHGPRAVAPGVFAQANEAGNQAMIAHVAELVRGEPRANELLELFAGSGNFTRALAPLADRVRAVEGSPTAVALARQVVRAENVTLVEAPVEKALQRARADAVVLDPPRDGLSPEAARAIDRLAPRFAVYVSCDPGTLARDLTRLPGLALARLRAFDLYPHSAHLEAVALLRRR